jgi:hypothetical protein
MYEVSAFPAWPLQYHQHWWNSWPLDLARDGRVGNRRVEDVASAAASHRLECFLVKASNCSEQSAKFVRLCARRRLSSLHYCISLPYLVHWQAENSPFRLKSDRVRRCFIYVISSRPSTPDHLVLEITHHVLGMTNKTKNTGYTSRDTPPAPSWGGPHQLLSCCVEASCEVA